MRPPIVVRVDTSDLATLDRVLGTARQTLLGRRGSVFVLDIGPAALGDRAQTALVSWLDRNIVALRGHLDALVFVAPTWTFALLLKLALRGRPPPVPYAVVRKVEGALSWATARHEALGQPAPPRARPSGR